MKNIALPLLLAGSASAQPTRKSAMAQDRAVPAPILIAAEWAGDGDCADAAGAVAGAATAIQTAQAALDTLEGEAATALAATLLLVADKDTAVAAVVAKITAIAGDLAADDTAQQAELAAKTALDNATIGAASALAAKTAADALVVSTNAALTAATDLQTAMGTAATGALNHYTAEQGQTATLTTDKNTADGTLVTNTNAIAGLTTLYNSAKSTSDTSTAATTSAKATWDTALAWKTAYDPFILAATDPSVAKTKADTDGVKTTKTTAKDNCAATTTDPCFGTHAATFFTAATTSTNTVNDWLFIAETWTLAGNAAAICVETATMTAQGAANSVATEILCQAACAGKIGWMESAVGAGIQTPGVAGATGTTHCFGYEWDGTSGTLVCKLAHTFVPTSTGALNSTADRTCKVRGKMTASSNKASDMYTNWEQCKANSTKEQGVQTGLGLYNTAYEEYWDALEAYTLADAVLTAYTVAQAAKDLANTTANNAHTPLAATSSSELADTNTKNTNLINQTNLVATSQAAVDAAVALLAAQTAEEAAQLAVKALADGDLAAQTPIVAAATTTRDDAVTAAATADTASTTAATGQTTAQTTYDAAVTAASASAATVATPWAELTTLRATMTTATATLATDLDAVADAGIILDAAQADLDGAVATHLAAVVACKEEQFDIYAANLAEAEAARALKLTTIQALVDAEIAATPAAGTANARCEKAMSNGTFRPARGEQTCGEGLCCGAAKVPVPGGEAVMTVETCQAEAATVYAYRPPRAPLATTAPATVNYDFTCIQGAQKLATAASALAAAVYMLA